MSSIANKEEISTSREKRVILDILERTLELLEPNALLAKSISCDGNTLKIKHESIDISDRNIYVIGAGKSAGKMALGLEEILGDKIAGGFVNTTEAIQLKHLKVNKASHPFPTKSTITATKKILALKKKMKENDILLFLLSGGASAMFALPPDEIPVNDFIKAYEILVNAGLSVDDMNKVRKHISQVKGGKVTELFPQQIYTFIISDVLSDDISSVGSGPTDFDKSTFKDVKNIIKNIQLPKTVLDYIDQGFKGKQAETVKIMPSNSKIYLLGQPSTMTYVAKSVSIRKRLHTYVTQPLTGDTEEAAKSFVEVLKQQRKRPKLVLANAETTIKVPEKAGKGGRNQHFMLALMNEMHEIKEPWAVLSFDSDGRDFTKGVGGAIIDHNTLLKATEINKEDIGKHLKDHNSHALLKSVNALIKSEDTGINLCNLVIAVLGVYRTKSREQQNKKRTTGHKRTRKNISSHA
jgi:glycerate 2-kinase